MPGVHRNEPRKNLVNKDKDSGLPRTNLIDQVIDSRLTPLPKGVPRTEEDKQIFLVNLVRLREQRLTKAECAERLGVSERTIANYMAEPAYREAQELLISEAKQSGHVILSELISEAIGTLYELMSDKAVSPFVRYKAATELLDKAGYNIPRDEQQADSRAGVAEFLKQVEEKKKQQNIYIQNLNINGEQKEGGSALVVDSIPEDTPVHLLPYYSIVKPGGGLPDQFVSSRKPPTARKEDGE